MISAVILTHNNEKTIEKTLDSVSWCDEIICIDDGSIDETIDLAKKHQAIVFQRPLRNDFASQRNFGLQKAKGEWTLFLDSDEVVSDELKEEILLQIINNPTPSQKAGLRGAGKSQMINGYYIKRTDIFFGRELKHGETAQVKLLRLGRKKSGLWIGPVHEIWDIKGQTKTLTTPLLHTPHTTISQFVDSVNRYTTIRARELNSTGIQSNVFAIILYPLAKFFQNYIFRLGFLDGTAGCVMAIMMSLHSFLVRAKLYLLQKNTK